MTDKLTGIVRDDLPAYARLYELHDGSLIEKVHTT